jgi:hypothetical protein
MFAEFFRSGDNEYSSSAIDASLSIAVFCGRLALSGASAVGSNPGNQRGSVAGTAVDSLDELASFKAAIGSTGSPDNGEKQACPMPC